MSNEKKGQEKPQEKPKSYRVGSGGHYRLGRLYAEGEIVAIPAGEKPAKGWELVTEAEARAAVAPPKPGLANVPPTGRANDEDL